MEKDIIRDPLCIDEKYPPDMHSLFIEERLLGLVYLADGEGPHKTLLLLHGFPGNEKNLDIAHMIRRGGYNVLVFHYSGSWGSRGSYSFSQNYRDLQAVRSIMADAAFAREHRIDRDNIYLAGHSVGGFLTLLAARDGLDFKGFAPLAPYNLGKQAERIRVGDKEAFGETLELFRGGMAPLSGATPESLMEDILDNHDGWDLLGDPSAYSERKMLLVMAAEDRCAWPKIHQVPVAETLARAGGDKTVVSLSCSHDFPDKRVSVAEAIFEWLEEKEKR